MEDVRPIYRTPGPERRAGRLLPPRRWSALAAVALAGLVATACQAAAPPQAQTLDVEGRDFAFIAPDSVPAGVTTITFKNTGKQDHHIILTRLEQGKTMADFQRALSQMEKEGIPPWLTFVGGSGGIAAGGTSNTTQPLSPGTYALMCLLPDPADGAPHVAKGMVKPLTVTGSAVSSDLPAASDGMVSLKDYAFDMPTSFAAGKRTLRVVNDGQDIHEFQVLKLSPGKTAADIGTFFSGQPSGPPPFAMVGGTNAFSRGLAGNTSVDFAPGTYAAVCFVPDKKGTPHLALGMVKEFTVQ